jgi:hypothetical protein
MTRYLLLILFVAMTALSAEEVSTLSPASDQTRTVTFNKDVLPILENNCQSCHRPGGIGPMSLLTYENSRPWAKAIKTAVVSKKMPPWFADPHYGEFRNAPKLSESDIKTLVAWADSGSSEGSAADKTSVSPEWNDGWRIRPDVVVSMPAAHKVGAKGDGEIKEFFIESPFKEDTWVSSIEIRPGDPSVVHHVILQVPNGPSALPKGVTVANRVEKDGKVTTTFTVDGNVDISPELTRQLENRVAPVGPANSAGLIVSNRQISGISRIDGPGLFGGSGGYSDILARSREQQTGIGEFMTMEAIYAPGSQPMDFGFTDSAKLIPGGRPIRLEVHYTPNGKATTDKTMVGFTLANGVVERQFVIMAPEHLVDTRKPIPAGASNHETVGELTFTQDVHLAWFMPHMHLRGKDMSYKLIFPDGREQTVLSARFNFHWQLGYELEKPIKVPTGTRMVVTAHHDNSANNPANPSPKQSVGWGEMTAQEMMLPWFGVIVDTDASPSMIARYKPGEFDGPVPRIDHTPRNPAVIDVKIIPAPGQEQR